MLLVYCITVFQIRLVATWMKSSLRLQLSSAVGRKSALDICRRFPTGCPKGNCSTSTRSCIAIAQIKQYMHLAENSHIFHLGVTYTDLCAVLCTCTYITYMYCMITPCWLYPSVYHISYYKNHWCNIYMFNTKEMSLHCLIHAKLCDG